MRQRVGPWPLKQPIQNYLPRGRLTGRARDCPSFFSRRRLARLMAKSAQISGIRALCAAIARRCAVGCSAQPSPNRHIFARKGRRLPRQSDPHQPPARLTRQAGVLHPFWRTVPIGQVQAPRLLSRAALEAMRSGPRNLAKPADSARIRPRHRQLGDSTTSSNYGDAPSMARRINFSRIYPLKLDRVSAFNDTSRMQSFDLQ